MIYIRDLPFKYILISTIVLTFIFLFSSLAFTQECRSPSDIHSEIISFYAEQNRETKQIYHFERDEAQAYLAFYNALPPVTNLVGDEVLIYMTLPSPVVTEAVFLNGCFVAGGAVLFENYQRLWMEFYVEI